MLEDFGADLIINRLQNKGFEAYYVGGCVRNYLLGKQIDDYDLTTSASPEIVCEIFNDFKIFTTGIKHGTVSIIVNDRVYELTTFRTDGKYLDARHPTSVTYCVNINEDLSRRDFTINAIAFNKKLGFIDNFNGIYDIKKGLIKCVGDPKTRFSEDALRILRALRFASVYSLEIEEKTSQAIFKSLHLLKSISAERISIEIGKIILGEKASVILNDYKEVLFEILPQLKLIDDFQLVLSVLAECPKSLELRFAVLLYQINEYFDEISTIFKFSNAIKDKISLLIKMHGCDYNSKASIKRLIRVFEKTVFDFFDFEFAIATAINDENKLIEIKTARILATEIINNGECYSLKQLAINGHDLLELGYKGRQIQQGLNFLLDGVVEERVVNNKNSLIKYLMGNNG